MSRAFRLLDLVQVLRRHRRPVTAAALAEELGVSERTIYRDVATLNAQGAAIDGEAGLGYVMRSGFTLPPLMFDEDELDAVVLGLRWVAQRGDPDLARAAQDALAKIAAVLPDPCGDPIADTALLAPPGPGADLSVDIGRVRYALRHERKLAIRYVDRKGVETVRTIWPIAIGYFDSAEVVAAWCDSRRPNRCRSARSWRRLDSPSPDRPGAQGCDSACWPSTKARWT